MRPMLERQMMLIGGIVAPILKLALTLFAIMLLYQLVFPVTSILHNYERKLSLEVKAIEILPQLEDRVAVLSQRIEALSSSSIDARVLTIEKALEVGEVDPSQLTSIQQMREDIKIVKNNVFADPQLIIDFKTLQRDYRDLSEQLPKKIDEADVRRELDLLNNIYFATLSVVGLILAILGGSWFAAFKRARNESEQNAG